MGEQDQPISRPGDGESQLPSARALTEAEARRVIEVEVADPDGGRLDAVEQ